MYEKILVLIKISLFAGKSWIAIKNEPQITSTKNEEFREFGIQHMYESALYKGFR